MSKHTYNQLSNDNSGLHSTPQGDELTPQQLIDFFNKIAENSATEIIKLQVHPDLDNPSLPIRLQGIYILDAAIADSGLITGIEYHLSLDGTFTDIAGSPYADIASFNTGLATEVTADSTYFSIKVGGTITGTNYVDVLLRMIKQGASI